MIQRVAGGSDFIEATAPSLDHAAYEENMGQLRIERLGGMFGKQAFLSAKIGGHLAIVPDTHMIFVYADLDGIAGGIVLVNHRDQQDFPESFVGEIG